MGWDGLGWALERVGGRGEVHDCLSRRVSGGEERFSGIVGVVGMCGNIVE